MTRRCLAVVLPGVVILGAVALSACSSGCASLFTPSAEVVDNSIVAELEAAQQSGAGPVDHSTFGELLESHVDYEAGRVDYAGLKDDEAALDAYLDQIAQLALAPLGRDDKLAVLINAYNAFTLKLILEHYPDVESIKDLDSPWKTTRWVVGGHTLSLDDLEHGLIRPLYKDSRIHFAVNCAAIGCPPLAPWPYEATKLDEQLDRAARRTLGDQRYARVEDEKLLLTQVMNWYRRDFVGDDFSPRADTLPEYAARFGSDQVRELVGAKGGEPPVGFLEYDWKLNDVP